MKCKRPLAHKPELFSGNHCKTCEAERGEDDE